MNQNFQTECSKSLETESKTKFYKSLVLKLLQNVVCTLLVMSGLQYSP